MTTLPRKPISPVSRAVLVLAEMLATTMLSGCLMAGVTSGGHFFLFPSLGVIVVIIVLFALLRRR